MCSRNVLLGLETSGCSSTSGSLELSSLGDDERSGVGTWTHAEVSDGLSVVLLSSEEHDVGSGRCSHGELVEGDALTSGLCDSSSGGRGKSQGGDGEFWDVDQSVVVGDGSDDGDGSLGLGGILRIRDLSGNVGDRDGRSVDLGHEQSSEDDLVELRVRSSGEESIQLDEKLQVYIVGFRSGSLTLLDVYRHVNTTDTREENKGSPSERTSLRPKKDLQSACLLASSQERPGIQTTGHISGRETTGVLTVLVQIDTHFLLVSRGGEVVGIKRKGGWKDITQILFLRDKEREERAAAARRLLIEPGHVYIFLISCALHCDTKSDVRSGTARDGPSEGGKGFPSGSGACELLGMGTREGKIR